MKRIEFNLPAVRGTQGIHAVYTAMCPIRLLPKLFPIIVDGDSAASVSGSFRGTSSARVREIAQEIVDRQGDVHLDGVTISVERQVRFVAAGTSRTKFPAIGNLFIPLEARLTIVDGAERVYALQQALAECPSLADDSISMLLHVDPDGSRRGRLISDAMRQERTPAPSRRIAIDDRDELARLTRDVIAAVPVFRDAIEMERATISNRSRKLFTLSALYQANRTLLADHAHQSYGQRTQLATQFWTEVARHIPGWSEVIQGEQSAAEIRAKYVHCHAIAIAAIARAGRALLAASPKGWKKQLARLASLDWSRTNTTLWEGRAMIGGRLSKSNSAVARAGNVVKQQLGLELTRDERAQER